jgi:Flp pilus assembly pilin Flp
MKSKRKKNQKGNAAVEYALLLSLIAGISATAIADLGFAISSRLQPYQNIVSIMAHPEIPDAPDQDIPIWSNQGSKGKNDK